MNLARIAILSLVNVVVYAGDLAVKCCKERQEVALVNNEVSCIESTNLRFEILTNSSDFLSENITGTCTDYSEGQFYIFQLQNNNSTSKTNITSTPFPKCCPLNFTYNTTTHSCFQNINQNTDFITNPLIKVGLPECHMIYDQILPNGMDINSVLGSKQPGTRCLDRNQDGEMLMRQCRKDLSICDDARCFKKCCPDGQSFVGGGFCKDTFVRGIEIQDQTYSTYIEDPEDEYELIYGAGCPDVTIYPSNTIQYSITKDGVFKYYSNYSDKFIQELESDLSGYCIEHATKGSISGYYVFRCFQNREANNKFSFTLWAKIASCVFLVMTVALYFYLGETKSTFGKILVSYCVAMFILMLVLILSMLKSDDVWCKIKGYLLIFFNCSTHAWVNVISYDIWGTFGSPKKTICVMQKKKNLRKFLNYCLYAWGIALVHMILLIILENTSFLPDSVQPRIGNLYCFIENVNYGRVVFLLVPYMVLQIINIVLFVRTAIYCIRVQNEIQKMNDTFRKNDSGRFILAKDRLTLLVKLAVVMGIIWLVELLQNFFKNMISYSEFTKTLEIVLDTITCCQGVFIFLIFICKKKILNLLKKKLGCISWTDSTSSTPFSESNIILQGRKASATTYAAENPILST